MSIRMSQVIYEPNHRRSIRVRDGSWSSDEQFKQILASWSTDTRFSLKQLIDWKNEYSITDDIFFHLLQQTVNESELKEEEPSPYDTQESGEPNKCDFLTAQCLESQIMESIANKESTEDTQDSEESDCESVHSDFGLDDLNNDLIENNHHDNDDIIAVQSQQLEVNDDDHIIIKKSSNLRKNADIFYPSGCSPVSNNSNKLGPIEEEKELEPETELPPTSPSPPSSSPNTPIICNIPSSPPSSSSSTPIHSLTPLNSTSNLSVNIPPVSPPSPDAVLSTPAMPSMPSLSVPLAAAPVTPPANLDAINNIVTSNLMFLQNLPAPSSFVPSSVPNTCTSSVPNTEAIQVPYVVGSTPNLLDLAASIPLNTAIAIPFYPMAPPALSVPVIPAPPSISQPVSAPNHVQQTREQSVYINQFETDTQPTSQQMDNDECMTNMQFEMNDIMHKPLSAARQWTASQPKGLNFQPKFNNHAKGNFYISKEMISKMTQQCIEEFVTDKVNITDERLAFGYYKESVAMQINDDQIRIIQCQDGKHRIIIDIDLHFKSNGQTMYLVAEENHKDFRHKVRWCIIAFMSREQVYSTYGVRHLPESSRNQSLFLKAINNPPKMTDYQIHRMLRRTNFRGLPKKMSKRKDDHQMPLKKTRISEKWLKHYCEQSWGDHPAVPVVVIKGKNQWIEWKKFIRIQDRYGNTEYIGISLRYHSLSGHWKIECMDYDAGRIYYQHRLVGLPAGHQYSCSFNELRDFVTTALEITNF